MLCYNRLLFLTLIQTVSLWNTSCGCRYLSFVSCPVYHIIMVWFEYWNGRKIKCQEVALYQLWSVFYYVTIQIVLVYFFTSALYIRIELWFNYNLPIIKPKNELSVPLDIITICEGIILEFRVTSYPSSISKLFSYCHNLL